MVLNRPLPPLPLGLDRRQQILPGVVEGPLALLLETGGERANVDSGAGELGQNLLRIAAVLGQGLADRAVVGERLQGRLGHRVNGEGRGQGLYVEDIRGVGILAAGAGEEQPLRTGALVGETLTARGVEQLAVGAVGALADRDPQPVAQLVRDAVGHRHVPATEEYRGDRGHRRVQAGLDAAFEPPHIGVGGAEVLLGREEKGDVDRDAGEDRLLDRGSARGGAGDLDVEVVALRLLVQLRGLGDSGLGVVGEQGRDLERYPAVYPIGADVDRREEVGGVAQVGKRQLEEEILGRGGGGARLGDLLVVGVALRDRLVEDRRVGGEPGDRQTVDVAAEDPLAEHLARDVVEPEALPQLVQSRGRLHSASFRIFIGFRAPGPWLRGRPRRPCPG